MPKREVTKLEQFVIDTVKSKRTSAGYSQKQLSDLLLVSGSFIGDIESVNRRAKYNLSHINELAKIFDCSPKDFFPDTAFENE